MAPVAKKRKIMGNRTSVVWLFFDKVDGGRNVRCLCGFQLKYCSSTTNMKDHIDEVHEQEKEEKTRRLLKEKLDLKTQVMKRANSIEKANEHLITTITTSNLPLRLLKSKHFKQFCWELNPSYVLPSPYVVRRKLKLKRLEYMEKMRAITDKIQKCWISTDGWDFKNEKTSLYAVYVYYINKNFKRKSLFLGLQKLSGRATGGNIGKLITGVLNEFGISHDKVIGLLSDSASNLKSFAQRNDFDHVSCQSHNLSLILNRAAKTTKVAEVMKKIGSLVNHLSRAKQDREAFKTMSKQLQIKGPIPCSFSETRWGGAIMQAEAYLKHKQCLTSSSSFQEYLTSAEEESTLNSFVNFGRPFLDALTTAESDSSYASESIIQLTALLEKTKRLNQSASQLVKVATDYGQEKLRSLIGNIKLCMMALLDPRIAYTDDLLFPRTWEEVEEELESYATSLNLIGVSSDADKGLAENEPADETLIGQFLSVRRSHSVDRTFQNERCEYKMMIMNSRPIFSAGSSPLSFWRDYKDKFPILSTLAGFLLALPQSSAQTERLFSKCSQMCSSPKRNRMKSSTMNDILLSAALSCLQDKDDDDSDATTIDTFSEGEASMLSDLETDEDDNPDQLSDLDSFGLEEEESSQKNFENGPGEGIVITTDEREEFQSPPSSSSAVPTSPKEVPMGRRLRKRR